MYMSEHLVRMISYHAALNENDAINQSPNIFISVRQKLIIIIIVISIIIIIIDIDIIISCIVVLIKIIISISIFVSFMVIIIINFIQVPCFNFVQSVMTFLSCFFSLETKPVC